MQRRRLVLLDDNERYAVSRVACVMKEIDFRSPTEVSNLNLRCEEKVVYKRSAITGDTEWQAVVWLGSRLGFCRITFFLSFFFPLVSMTLQNRAGYVGSRLFSIDTNERRVRGRRRYADYCKRGRRMLWF